MSLMWFVDRDVKKYFVLHGWFCEMVSFVPSVNHKRYEPQNHFFKNPLPLHFFRNETDLVGITIDGGVLLGLHVGVNMVPPYCVMPSSLASLR